MDTLIANATPAVIETNFEALRGQLAAHLEDYNNLVVTEDSVAEAKKQATELNKLAGEIDTRRKEITKQVSEPIDVFTASAKELVTMCKDARQSILDQVDVFEAKRLDLCRQKVVELRDLLYQQSGVREEFQHAGIDGMVKLSYLTKAGELTAAACREVEAAVTECLNLQLRTDNRLSRLENESHRAGLHSTLTREHLEGILFAPDEQYIAGLEKLVARELERQEETERRAREKLEREQKEAAEAEARAAAQAEQKPEEPAAVEHHERATVEAEPETCAPTQAEPGRKVVSVSLLLGVNVSETTTPEQVKAALLKKLEAAGISDSIVSCKAQDLARRAA